MSRWKIEMQYLMPARRDEWLTLVVNAEGLREPTGAKEARFSIGDVCTLVFPDGAAVRYPVVEQPQLSGKCQVRSITRIEDGQ